MRTPCVHVCVKTTVIFATVQEPQSHESKGSVPSLNAKISELGTRQMELLNKVSYLNHQSSP